MEESNNLIKLRRDKLAQLCAKGVNPYINRFKVKDSIDYLNTAWATNEVVNAAKRSMVSHKEEPVRKILDRE